MAKILVAEDESSIRTLWGRFLERWGYTASMAENGQIALNLAREERFDILITDLAMPVMTGQELIYNLKQEQPSIEILVTTGHGTVETAVEMMKAGAFDFLTKPINFAHAELILRKCLESVQAKEENLALRQSNEDLKLINELKEKFIAITSHELRTPVGVISNLCEILGTQVEKLETPNLLPLMMRTSQQLNEIVEQMHEMSQVHSGKLELDKTEFNLLNLCREVDEEFLLIRQNRGQQLHVNIPEDLNFFADKIKFKKVIREMMQNAIKFTPDKGSITLGAGKNGNDFVFEISETGVGISEDNREKIFHLFYEVGEALHHHTSKDGFMGGGMGVGLALVRDIVDAHEGKIDVQSNPEGGSIFTVTIPVMDGTS